MFKKEQAYKLIATKGKDEILSMKFTREQMEEVIEKTMDTNPQVILIVKE